MTLHPDSELIHSRNDPTPGVNEFVANWGKTSDCKLSAMPGGEPASLEPIDSISDNTLLCHWRMGKSLGMLVYIILAQLNR